ncbi:MAG: hypothetical protein JF924_07010 [Candidatus Dormibacteraeota bacterium]|nr:hypothetical protein [Candidatus Dormibacteraeota bacterium]
MNEATVDEEEIGRLVRARARAWRGTRGRAQQSCWAAVPGGRRRGRWLPAATALAAALVLSVGAAASASGPAPVRGVLAPVGDRVTHPWQGESPVRRPVASPETRGQLIPASSISVSSESSHGPRALPTAAQPSHPASSSKPKQDERSRAQEEQPKPTSSPSPHGDD